MNLRQLGSTFFGSLHGVLRRALLKVAYGKAAVGDTENGGGGPVPQVPCWLRK